MTEKVKVSREVADAIEGAKDIFNLGAFVKFLRSDGGFRNEHSKVLRREFLPEDKDVLLQAMHHGYEVEPEFERGQYIVHNSGDIRQVVNVYEECLEIEDGDGDRFFWNKKYVRHATASEIAQEKERRFWNRHGRDIKEYRIGDVVHDSNGDIGMVTGFKESVGYASLLVSVSGVGFCMRGELKLICPVEKRLDLSHE